MNANITLAIESAIAGGSISLLSGEDVIGSWMPEENVMRSELLLARVDNILTMSGIGAAGLGSIAVSIGPGSFTGIRIGIATALGLARSLGIKCSGINLLRAMAFVNGYERDSVVVLPVGRGTFAWKQFTPDELISPDLSVETGTLADLGRFLNGIPGIPVYSHSDAFAVLPKNVGVFDAGRDLATAVGRAARRFDDGLAPFYARETLPTASRESKYESK